MKHTLAALIAALLMSSPVGAEDLPDYRESMERAGAAFQAEEWPALNEALDAAQAARPWSLYVYRNRILARMLAGRPDDALALASKAAERGLSLDLAGHPAFDELKALAAFAPIADRMAANAAPMGEPGAAREFSQSGLLPEAITYDRKGDLYIGSVRNGSILKAGKKDETLSLISQASGGVFDLEVRDGVIWAAVNNQLAYENANAENAFAAIMTFDAKTGAPMREVKIKEDAALLGDLEVAKDGTVYASDSITPRLYRLQSGGETPEVFAADPRFVNPQGIALDEKNDRIFLADYLSGLFVIDARTGKATALENIADAHLGGIDGLYSYKGGLIGIQNGTTPQRIVWIGLNDDATAITTFIAMQQNLAGWNEPTHGAVIGKEFRYIATSNWPSYDEDWNVRDGAVLQPLRILTLPLESN